jgi:hypothetical protein
MGDKNLKPIIVRVVAEVLGWLAVLIFMVWAFVALCFDVRCPFWRDHLFALSVDPLEPNGGLVVMKTTRINSASWVLMSLTQNPPTLASSTLSCQRIASRTENQDSFGIIVAHSALGPLEREQSARETGIQISSTPVLRTCSKARLLGTSGCFRFAGHAGVTVTSYNLTSQDEWRIVFRVCVTGLRRIPVCR